MEHARAVNRHVAGFVIGDEPARAETLGELGQRYEDAAESQPPKRSAETIVV
jgi:hypothetical protein